MNRLTRIVLATVAVAAAGGAVAATAQADGRWQGGDGHHMGGYHQDGGMHDGGKRGHGMMKMFETFDTNGDGALTQEEIDGVRTARFAKFDGDGDKVLTLAEYEALWLDAMNQRMVRGFQRLDTDGDGKVTAAEFEAPFGKMVARADRNEDGKLDRDDRPQHGMTDHGKRMHDDGDRK
jgi:hypothetical protein